MREDADEQPTRDVFVAELQGQPGSDGHIPVAKRLGQLVASLVDKVRAWHAEQRGESSPREDGLVKPMAELATTTALGALEGTLKGKSLEGAWKEAQILHEYAAAREANATAELREAEAAKVRQDAALERVERWLALGKSLGFQVSVSINADGQPMVAIGDNLVQALQAGAELALPAGAEPGAAEESQGAGTGETHRLSEPIAD